MADINGFDANQVEDNRSFDAVPPGDYVVQWVESEWKDGKNAGSRYIEVEMEIMEGPHAGQHLWDRLNLVNANQQAVQIANGQLKSACVAVGNMQPKDTSELHYKPMIAKVKVDKPRDGYEAGNSISGYKAIQSQFSAPPQGQVASGATAPQQAAPPQGSVPASGAAPSAPPWARSQ